MNETVKIIFGLLGGLAVFIYGMNMMSETVRILNPDLLVVIVLPSFISIWISVVLLKKYQHDL